MYKIKKMLVHGCYSSKPYLQCKDCQNSCTVYDGVQIGVFRSINDAVKGLRPVSEYSLIHYSDKDSDMGKTVQFWNSNLPYQL